MSQCDTYNETPRQVLVIALFLLAALISSCSKLVSPVALPVHPSPEKLKVAADLFRQKKYLEALPELEKLATDYPADDQVVFGLGVALIFLANGEQNPEARRQLVIRARQLLLKARELGVEDYLLDRKLEDIPAEGNDDKAVEDILWMWSLHPPKVFDEAPPDGIKLPDGYRHKASTDFEGGRFGVIWKTGGLRIQYEFAYPFGAGDAVTTIKESQIIWCKEEHSQKLKFIYVLTRDNRLTISSYDPAPYADFYVTVRNDQEVEEVLAMIKGLKARK